MFSMAIRWTSTEWLLLLAQTLFSGDLILNWVRMERFRDRTLRVHESLRQFFLQGGDTTKANGLAIVVAAFTDYECAKDEAAARLDSSVFNKMNSDLSQRWEELEAQLKIT